MSAYLMGRVFYTDLPPHLRLTLLALADAAQDDGTKVMLGQQRIAVKIGASERAVRAHLGELRDLGYIRKLGRLGSHGQDRHEIVVDKLPTHEQIRLALARPATSADRQPAAARKPNVTSTGNPASLDRKPASANTSVIRQEIRPPHKPPHDAFDEFWASYPRHVGKRAARAAFVKASERAPAETIIAGARRYHADPNRDPAFTAHPTTWLNQDRWDDDPLPARGAERSVRHADRAAEILIGALHDQSRSEADHGAPVGSLPA